MVNQNYFEDSLLPVTYLLTYLPIRCLFVRDRSLVVTRLEQIWDFT